MNKSRNIEARKSKIIPATKKDVKKPVRNVNSNKVNTKIEKKPLKQRERTFVKDNDCVQQKVNSNDSIKTISTASNEIKDATATPIEIPATPVTEEDKVQQINELLAKVAVKTTNINEMKKTDGHFTEVVGHGVFKVDSKKSNETIIKIDCKISKGNLTTANEVALEAKNILEADPNMPQDVRGAVISKLFELTSMVHKTHESKQRLQQDFDKFKEKHIKDMMNLEKEYIKKIIELQKDYEEKVALKLDELLKHQKNLVDTFEMLKEEEGWYDRENILDDRDRESAPSEEPCSMNFEMDSLMVPNENDSLNYF